MILTDLKGLERYAKLYKGFEEALEYLNRNDLASLALGRETILGDAVFCNCSEYETKCGEAVYEAHRSYIDIQYVARGEEKMGYLPVDELTVTQEYDADKDCLFGVGNGSYFDAPAGTVAIFFPEDAHAPGLAKNGAEKVKKCVVKVRV